MRPRPGEVGIVTAASGGACELVGVRERGRVASPPADHAPPDQRGEPPVVLGIDEGLLELALGLVPAPSPELELGSEDRERA